MGTDGPIAPRETSGITTRLILDYVRREIGPEGVDRLLEVAGVKETKQELLDEDRWFSYELKHRLFDAAKTVLDDPRAPYHIGQRALEFKVGVPLMLALRTIGSTKRAYQNVIAVAGKFTTTHSMEVIEISEERATVRYKDVRGVGIKRAEREYTMGLLSCVPELFGLPLARVKQVDYVNGEHPYYEYEVTWDSPRKWVLKGLLGGVAAGAALAIMTVALTGPTFMYAVAACLVVFGVAINAFIGRLRVHGRMLRQLHEQLEQKEKHQLRLEASLSDLVSDLHIEEVLHKITEHARAAVGGKEYALMLDMGGGRFSTSHSSELPGSVIKTLERYSESIGGGELEEPLLITNVEDVADLEDLSKDPDMPIGSICMVPLVFKGDRLGLLVALSGITQGFLPLDLEQLELYAAQAAIALANAKFMSRLEEQASKDPLTGMLNHREFHERLSNELDSCEQSGGLLSLVLVIMDLDDFKAVNDELGHRSGDRVLRKASERILKSVPSTDVAFRIGGDEFALVLSGADGDRARAVAEEVQRSVPGGEPSVSISFGIAEWPKHGKEKEELISSADEALQIAKNRALQERQGESRVAAAGTAPTSDGARIERAGELERLQLGNLYLERQRRKLALANRLGSKLARLVDPSMICRLVVGELHSEFHYYMASVVALDEKGEELSLVAGSGLVYEQMMESGERFTLPLSQGVTGRVARTGKTALVNDVRLDPDFSGGKFNEETRSELCAPIKVGDRVWGALNLEEPQAGAFDRDDMALVRTVADQMGSVIQSAELYEELENAYVATVEALSGALEANDRYTATHAREIAELAVSVGLKMGLKEDEIKTLRYAALFHDIGKLAIPNEILNKDTELEKDELEKIAQHTVIGQKILAPVPFLDEVLPLVRHAHERWDGQGYPDGLSGEEIPIGSRIIFVCDAYNAMTSNRPYRRAMPEEEAVAEICRESGGQFDPTTVGAFLRVLESRGIIEPPLKGLGEKPEVGERLWVS